MSTADDRGPPRRIRKRRRTDVAPRKMSLDPLEGPGTFAAEGKFAEKLNYRNATAARLASPLPALAQPGALLAQPVQVGRGT